MRSSARVGSKLLSPVAAILMSVLTIGAAYAEEGSSSAHSGGNGPAAPAANSDHASAKGSGGDGAKDSAKDGAK